MVDPFDANGGQPKTALALLLGAALLTAVAGLDLTADAYDPVLGWYLLGLSTAMCFGAAAIGARSGGWLVWLAGRPSVDSTVLNTGFTRGRQLFEAGKPVLAPLRVMSSGRPTVEIAADLRTPTAAAWRAMAQTSHASAAAFQRLGLELMSVGAPRRLIAQCLQNALDEVAQSAACFAVAQSVDGVQVLVEPHPAWSTAGSLAGTREQRLEELAVSSLLQGVALEGASAEVAEMVASQAIDPFRGVLSRIARDERHHASHAVDIVAYCLESGGPGIAFALRGAAAQLAALPPAEPLPEGPDLRTHGVARAADTQDALSRGRYRAISLVEALLDAPFTSNAQAAVH